MKQFSRLALLILFSFWTAGFVFAQDNKLHEEYDRILREYVSEGMVDYTGLKKNRATLDAYLIKLSFIDKKQYDECPHDEQLAYLINLYNAATLKLILNHYPVKSIKDIGSFFKSPWKKSFIILFGNKISLDTLEHDIIRRDFKDPRIHMALVCAAKGCPPLRSEAYSAGRLNDQLNDQSQIYLRSSKGMIVDRIEGKVYLSEIFKWYKSDFKSVTEFAEKHSGMELDGLSVRWLDYDWSLNEQ